MERSGTNALGVRRPARESSITLCRGERLCPPKQREALSFRASANTGVGIRLPSPPSEREVSARSADGGRDAPRFSLPQSAAPTAPSQRGPNSAAARQRGTAALSGRRDAVPYKNNAAPLAGRRAFSVHVWHRRRRVIFAAFTSGNRGGIPPKVWNYDHSDFPKTTYRWEKLHRNRFRRNFHILDRCTKSGGELL